MLAAGVPQDSRYFTLRHKCTRIERPFSSGIGHWLLTSGQCPWGGDDRGERELLDPAPGRAPRERQPQRQHTLAPPLGLEIERPRLEQVA